VRTRTQTQARQGEKENYVHPSRVRGEAIIELSLPVTEYIPFREKPEQASFEHAEVTHVPPFHVVQMLAFVGREKLPVKVAHFLGGNRTCSRRGLGYVIVVVVVVRRSLDSWLFQTTVRRCGTGFLDRSTDETLSFAEKIAISFFPKTVIPGSSVLYRQPVGPPSIRLSF